MDERALLIRDKYQGDASVDLTHDLARLAAGEPLAYVIGWMPFLGLRIELATRPLIPRPETEWWTEQVIAHIEDRFGNTPFRVLDLCAGSGAIGLALLSRFPHAHVAFGELVHEHASQIQKNINVNHLDGSRATVRTGDLFTPFTHETFDLIVTNPPYIPSERVLEESVTAHEPSEALFGGTDGLSIIRSIAAAAAAHLTQEGEVWMECDIDNIEEAAACLRDGGARTTQIHTDLYGRPRVVVGYYP